MEDFKCLNKACSHEWQAPPGIVTCPKCNGVYVKWISFDKWEAFDTDLSSVWRRVR